MSEFKVSFKASSRPKLSLDTFYKEIKGLLHVIVFSTAVKKGAEIRLKTQFASVQRASKISPLKMGFFSQVEVFSDSGVVFLFTLKAHVDI